MDETTLLTFNAISEFINALAEIFGKRQKSLKLYSRIISLTNFTNKECIEKNVEIFRKFCEINRLAISEKSIEKFACDTIKYSDRIFINMTQIFKMADIETTKTIWVHLLNISARVDPKSQAKQILEKSLSSSTGGGTEEKFITNVIDDISKNVDPNKNPVEMIGDIMKSGIFGSMVQQMDSGIKSGKMDIGNLFGLVQGMMSNMGNLMDDKKKINN